MKNWIFEKMNFLYHSERIEMGIADFNPLNANHTKWSNTLKQFVRNLPTNCLSVYDHFVKLALKVLIYIISEKTTVQSVHYSIKFAK